MASTIGEILPEAARRFGDSTALIVQDDAFSFSELESMSNRVANGLVSVGVVPGDRVTLYGANCWEWIVAYYAIAKSGAVVNPISSMLTAEEVRYVVADAGARVVVSSVDKGTAVLDLVGTAQLSSVVLWVMTCLPPRHPFRRGSRRGTPNSPRFIESRASWRRSATRRARRDTRRVQCRATGL
jgi:long-chain acyl-CoA synthetase